MRRWQQSKEEISYAAHSPLKEWDAIQGTLHRGAKKCRSNPSLITPPKNINSAERCRPLTPSLSETAKWFFELLKDHPC